MNETERSIIKKQLADAMEEPTVSPDFVRQLAVRAEAITAGREAERKLRTPGLSPEDQLTLAAQSTVGRLMLGQKPPDGVSVQRMVDQLIEQDRFRKAISGPTEQVLRKLASGELIREVGTPAPEEKRSGAAAPEHSVEKKTLQPRSREIPGL